MWELDCKEGWALKNWCFWSVVLEKTWESLGLQGDQPWDFFGWNDAKAETPVLWPPHVKSCLIGKDSDAGRDWGQEEKGTTEDAMAGWHHGLDGCEFEWTPGFGDGQGSLACCDSWGRKESDTTGYWTELKGRQDSDWNKGQISSWDELCCPLLPTFCLVTGKEVFFDGDHDKSICLWLHHWSYQIRYLTSVSIFSI